MFFVSSNSTSRNTQPENMDCRHLLTTSNVSAGSFVFVDVTTRLTRDIEKPGLSTLDGYRDWGGYRALEKALREKDPDGIAQTYLAVLRQPRNAWSLEVELRPWVETF